ncbi:short-subunit dehydrogenase [Streptosporangium album]|uniref:Short-subunit dehydrogenase n=1 Tax=Streptosporangium album TaxID=47479 RepID=A0A7W7WBJ6_9ACTN|nr:hypothetical protein [Streptosporangium album]MBB4941622.1 short-subunit dehydrogenase [Streptosporangium album]
MAADVATPEGAEKIIAAEPDVDILINNTGIFSATPVFEISDAERRRFF